VEEFIKTGMTRPGLLRLLSGDMRRQDVERQSRTTKEPDQLDVVMVRYAAAFYALRSAFTAPTTDTVRPARLSPFPSFCFCPFPLRFQHFPYAFPCPPLEAISVTFHSPYQHFSLQHFSFSVWPPTTRTVPAPISGLTRFCDRARRDRQVHSIQRALRPEDFRQGLRLNYRCGRHLQGDVGDNP
jgi:hypothetical protein